MRRRQGKAGAVGGVGPAAQWPVGLQSLRVKEWIRPQCLFRKCVPRYICMRRNERKRPRPSYGITRLTLCRFSLRKRKKVTHFSYPSHSHVLMSSYRAKSPASYGSTGQARSLMTIYEYFSYISVTQRNRRPSKLPGNTIMKAR